MIALIKFSKLKLQNLQIKITKIISKLKKQKCKNYGGSGNAL